MTVNSSAATQIFEGNGVTNPFSSTIVAAPSNATLSQAASNIQITYTDITGTAVILSPTVYTLAFNANYQGFTVLYPKVGSPIINGTLLQVSRIVPLTQPDTIANQGSFSPDVIEGALDNLELQIQQVSARSGSYRGVWSTNVAYNTADMVIDGANGANTGNYYTCAIPNTSGVWSTDLANGDWILQLNIASINANIATATAAAATATTQAGISTTQAGISTTQAGISTTEAGIATAQAVIATTAATQASNYATSYNGTSATSLLIATGANVFTTQASKLWVNGQYLQIASNANAVNYMHGTVTSYSGTTLTMNITDIGGSGTFADWNISISGTQGPVGPTGPAGAGNVIAASNLTNNTLVKGNGGTTGVQTTGITVDSSNNASGIGTIASGQVTAVNTSIGNSVIGLAVLNKDDTSTASAIKIDLQPVNNSTPGTRSAQLEAIKNGDSRYIDLNFYNSNASTPTKNWTMGYLGDFKANGATAAASPAAGDVNAKRLLVNGTAVVSSPFAAAYASAQTSYTNAGTFTLTHGLGGVPSLVQATLVCQTGQANYTAGDVVLAALGGANGADYGYSATLTSTSIVVRISGNGFVLPDKTSGTETALTAANWKLIFRAWL